MKQLFGLGKLPAIASVLLIVVVLISISWIRANGISVTLSGSSAENTVKEDFSTGSSKVLELHQDPPKPTEQANPSPTPSQQNTQPTGMPTNTSESNNGGGAMATATPTVVPCSQ